GYNGSRGSCSALAPAQGGPPWRNPRRRADVLCRAWLCRDPARRCGASRRRHQGYPLSLFPEQGRIVKAVVAQALVPNLERGEALLSAAAEPQSAAALLAEMIRGWAELARSPAGAIPKIVVSEAGNFPDLARFYRKQVVDRGMALLRRVLQLGIARG